MASGNYTATKVANVNIPSSLTAAFAGTEPGALDTFYFGRLARNRVEDSIPHVRGMGSARYTLGPFSGLVRANYYGTVYYKPDLPANDEVFGAKMLFDVEAGYQVTKISDSRSARTMSSIHFPTRTKGRECQLGSLYLQSQRDAVRMERRLLLRQGADGHFFDSREKHEARADREPQVRRLLVARNVGRVAVHGDRAVLADGEIRQRANTEDARTNEVDAGHEAPKLEPSVGDAFDQAIATFTDPECFETEAIADPGLIRLRGIMWPTTSIPKLRRVAAQPPPSMSQTSLVAPAARPAAKPK